MKQKMNREIAETLFVMNDDNLARVVNRWGKYDAKILVIDRRGSRTEHAPDWAKGFLDAWSSPKNAMAFLRELGVRQCGNGPRENQTDGECDIIFEHEKTGKRFQLNDNYYKFQCYVSVVRWALKIYLQQKKKD